MLKKYGKSILQLLILTGLTLIILFSFKALYIILMFIEQLRNCL